LKYMVHGKVSMEHTRKDQVGGSSSLKKLF
jgi:hypothetical protein